MTTDTVVHTTHRRLTTSRHQQRQRMRPQPSHMPMQQLNQLPKSLATRLPSTWPDRLETIFNRSNQRRPFRQPLTTQTKVIHRSQPTHRMHKATQLLNVSSTLFHLAYLFPQLHFVFLSIAAPAATTTPSNYSSYDAALYSAATMYVAQQTNKQPVCNG